MTRKKLLIILPKRNKNHVTDTHVRISFVEQSCTGNSYGVLLIREVSLTTDDSHAAILFTDLIRDVSQLKPRQHLLMTLWGQFTPIDSLSLLSPFIGNISW